MFHNVTDKGNRIMTGNWGNYRDVLLLVRVFFVKKKLGGESVEISCSSQKKDTLTCHVYFSKQMLR